jgi:hypothetical protein
MQNVMPFTAVFSSGSYTAGQAAIRTKQSPGLAKETEMTHRILVLTGLLLLLGGCASMNEQECLTGDWYAIGYEDGVKGLSADQVGSYRKACASHNVRPNLQQYQAGREQGLREFCAPLNGFNVGQRGASYGGVCPADMEVDFLSAFQSGRTLYQLRSQVNGASRSISYKESELSDLEYNIQNAEAQLISKETTWEQRALLLSDLKDMSRRQGELAEEIIGLEREQAVYQQRLAEYESSIDYNFF